MKYGDIDFDIGINEVETEIREQDGLVVVTDAEGEFVCLAHREMAEEIIKRLNIVNDIEQIVGLNLDKFQNTPTGDSVIGNENFPPVNNNIRTSKLERALAALQIYVKDL